MRPLTRSAPPARRSRVLLALVLSTSVVGALPALAAAPVPVRSGTLPAGVEALQPYIGQEGCDPVAKPGVLAFQQLLMSTYRDTGSLGIVRDCGIGSTSEHKEGRAFDWAVSAYNPNHVAEVKALTDWLIAPTGGEFASNARRFGIMYMIWNRQIWKAYAPESGWQPYGGANAHTDHVHFSFGWNGAKKATSWWTGKVAALDYGPYTTDRPSPPVPPPVDAPAQTPIDVKHAALGGDAGPLGAAIGAEADVLGGRYRPYVNGAIYWSTATGAREVRGEIWRRYLAMGGSRSPLGLPVADETAAADGRQSMFQKGRVLWSSATGAHAVYGDIEDRYTALAGPTGVLGLPVTDEVDVPGGRQVLFQGGSVVWASGIGARAVYGDIGDRYAALGGASGVLGQPVGEEVAVPGGRAVSFQHGYAVWAPGVGVRVLTGDIASRYLALGGTGGALGFPLADDAAVPGGRQAVFARGRLVWSAAGGARLLQGDIERKYVALGGTAAELGLPTSDETEVPGGRANSFTNGRILWAHGIGAHEVRGAISAAHRELGGEAGFLGMPVTDERTLGPDVRLSGFQRGEVYWSAATGAREVHGAIRDRWLALGGVAGPLGLPATHEREEPAGRSNVFARGAVYWSPTTGARAVVGLIAARYAADGGAWRYGMPLTEEYPVAGGRAQDFGRVVISWNATTGVVTVRNR